MNEENLEKTYKNKNMKFPLSLTFLILIAVSILWYLVSSGNFLPTNEVGEYQWLNIVFFSITSITIIGSVTTLIVYMILKIVFKKESGVQTYTNSIKWSLIITIGITIVLILNFFHILNIFWGLGILTVIIILLFVI